jgi:DNA-binding response OmpR family regulator
MSKLLIVEDDRINCLIYRQILQDFNFELDFAYDGEEGVNKFKSNVYDLMVLDLGLPKIDGLTVAKLVRQWEDENQKDYVPIVVVTADNSPQTRIQATACQIDEFFVKPFEFDAFLTTVNSYLVKKSAVKQ